MRHKFVYPENMLDKNQIFGLIYDSEQSEWDETGDKGDLAGRACMNFGERIMEEGFTRYDDREIQEWYYREYLPDRESDMKEGYDRGQL